MTNGNRETKRVELHTHSTASDGELEPERVAALVAERGAEVWALTDHDNCDGCALARKAARSRGLEFVPGIEISAYTDRSIHILGYGVDPESGAIEALSEELFVARRERMVEMLDELSELGVELEFEDVQELSDGAPLSRSHLSRALVEEGPAETRQEAFDRWIGVEAPAYVPVGWPSIPEAVECIHAAGGAAVLAHPGRYDVDPQIPDWIEAGLDGIEVDHPDHDEADVDRYTEMVDEFGLVATRGSDFHGRSEAEWAPFGEVEMAESELQRLRETIAGYR